jgi:hypothetical protein
MTVLATRTTWRKPQQLAPAQTPDLTVEEVANVKRALRVLRQRIGGNAPLATALGVNPITLMLATNRKRKPSVGMALRAARLAGVPLEDVLSGAWPKAGACPHCGRVDA